MEEGKGREEGKGTCVEITKILALNVSDVIGNIFNSKSNMSRNELKIMMESTAAISIKGGLKVHQNLQKQGPNKKKRRRRLECENSYFSLKRYVFSAA